MSTPVDTPVPKDSLYNDVPVTPEMVLTITKLPNDGSNGMCTIVGTGVGLMYQPNPDFFGIDICVYEVRVTRRSAAIPPRSRSWW